MPVAIARLRAAIVNLRDCATRGVRREGCKVVALPADERSTMNRGPLEKRESVRRCVTKSDVTHSVAGSL